MAPDCTGHLPRQGFRDGRHSQHSKECETLYRGSFWDSREWREIMSSPIENSGLSRMEYGYFDCLRNRSMELKNPLTVVGS